MSEDLVVSILSSYSRKRISLSRSHNIAESQYYYNHIQLAYYM